MRILVLSDSHGAVDRMRQAVELSTPQHMLFLGDCLPDADALQAAFPQLPMTTVPGNCDWSSTEEPERLIELGGKRILMMHGHTRSVKYTLLNAVCAAREYGADILLRAAFPAGGAERFAPRLRELSAGSLEMLPAGEEFLPGPRETAK